MFELLTCMIKEEWRMHSSLFGTLMFALFPVLVTVCAFICCLALPVFQTILSFEQLSLIAHYLFVLFGVTVGAFGLLGREVMNRRFGHASLLAYSSRSLPISERRIFANFFIKDVIYYVVLWILPFVLGFACAAPLLSVSFRYATLLLISLTLSFLIGLSGAFLLSTLYAHSSKVLVISLVLAAIALLSVTSYCNGAVLDLLPSVSFFLTPSPHYIALSLSAIVIPSLFSLIFFKMDYPEKKRRFKNSLVVLSKKLQFSTYSNFISKDLLDLKRSEGGVGKVLFSFIFPVALFWRLLSMLQSYVPQTNFILLFAIFLGIISSTIYNWLTEFDLFSSYLFLPVTVSSILKSKITSYALINLIPLIILVLVTVTMNQFNYFLPALCSFVSISPYALSVTIYLAGLYPNVLLYNAKIFLEYLVSILTIVFILIFLSIANPTYLFFSPVLLLISLYLIHQSYKKWDNQEQPSF